MVKKKPVDPTLTRTIVAALLAMTGPDVKKLVDGEIIDRLQNGRYRLDAATQYVKHLRATIEAKSDYSVLIEQEKHRSLKLENDLSEGRELPVEVLADPVGRVVATWLPVFQEFPIRVKRTWPEITGDRLDTAKRIVAELRNDLADAAVNNVKGES